MLQFLAVLQQLVWGGNIYQLSYQLVDAQQAGVSFYRDIHSSQGKVKIFAWAVQPFPQAAYATLTLEDLNTLKRFLERVEDRMSLQSTGRFAKETVLDKPEGYDAYLKKIGLAMDMDTKSGTLTLTFLQHSPQAELQQQQIGLAITPDNITFLEGAIHRQWLQLVHQ